MKKIKYLFLFSPILAVWIPSNIKNINNQQVYSLNAEDVNFSFNNTFSNNYDDTTTLGLNTTSNGWSNFNVGLLRESDGTIKLKAAQNYSPGITRRNSNTSSIDKTFYSTYDLYSAGNGFYINKFTKENGPNLFTNYHATSMGGKFDYWWFNQLNDGLENENILASSEIVNTIYAYLTLEENTSISLGLKVCNSNEWASVIRADTAESISDPLSGRWPSYNNQSLNPQNMNGISNVISQSNGNYLQSASFTYSYYKGKIDVYSGDTNLDSTAGLLDNLNFNDKEMSASEYLSQSSISEIQSNLTIQTLNGYPGMQYSVSKMDIYADDSTGSIYLDYSPTTVLKNGSIVPNNKTKKIEVASGFKITVDNNTPNTNTDEGIPYWIWIAIGAGSFVLILMCILVFIILKKKKEKAKKKNKNKLAPNSNQNRLLTNGGTILQEKGQQVPGRPINRTQHGMPGANQRPGQPMRPGSLPSAQSARPGQPMRPGSQLSAQPARPTPPPPITMNQSAKSMAPKLKK